MAIYSLTERLQTKAAEDFLDALERLFNREFEGENRKRWLEKLSGNSKAILDIAFDYLEENCGFLPTYADIAKGLKHAKEKMSAQLNPSAQAPSPFEERRKRVEDMLLAWEREWKLTKVYLRAQELGILQCVWRFARAMAETQAWLLAGGNAPGFPGEFRDRITGDERMAWYRERCQEAVTTGRINVTIPSWVGEECLLEKKTLGI